MKEEVFIIERVFTLFVRYGGGGEIVLGLFVNALNIEIGGKYSDGSPGVDTVGASLPEY